jgi:hypothetical protein|tara:strand:- start:1002 stop:1646 length:645 start_codon:yes stop_codon:yes gene_type:complete
MSFVAVGTAAVSLTMAGVSAYKANKAQKKAEAEEKQKRVEMDRLKGIYSNLDTSNPFANMENTMEDLTVNQKQAQFEAQQNQQTQSNTLNSLRGAAGGSGIAALAQSMAQSGQLSAQRASASIGAQESNNQRMSAQQASANQNKERDGDVKSRNMKRDQAGTLLGMSQQETAAARNQASMAEQAKWSAISSGVEGATGAMSAGMTSGAIGGGGN